MRHKMDFDSREFEREFYYGGSDLGAVYNREGTVFKVWAPAADRVRLNLYHTGSDDEPGAGLRGQAELIRRERGIWAVRIPGDLEHVYYTYTVETDGITRETQDVYSRACGVNGKRSMVVNLPLTDPENFRDRTEREKFLSVRHSLSETPVIYELHIKDFSNDKSWKLREGFRGKYLAFTVDEKNDSEKHKRGISYLKELGITHVHLLPFFDYGSVDEASETSHQFNWGYDPVNYNVPEGSYSTDSRDGAVRIRECKEMIQALHRRGIGVIMDVVFNHTYSLESSFENTVPGYYYRQDDKGEYANGSLCGNDTASERIMFRKYMIDSVLYWACEYQVDGFRFDLMGLHDVETINEIRKALDELPGGKDILMYGEPWSGDYSPMREGAVPALKENIAQLHERVAVFCDSTRDAIKGDVFVADEPGFINGAPEFKEDIREAVCAWCCNREKHPEFAPKTPGQIVSYVSAHDNFTLWDKLHYTLPSNIGKKRQEIDFSSVDELVLRQNKLAAGLYLTSLGMVFFQAGEEFGRTKGGLGDSYNAAPSLNQLSWERCKELNDLVDYYRGLIFLRRQLPEFYGRSAGEVTVQFHDKGLAGMVVYEIKKKGLLKSLYVICNVNEEKSVLTLPEGTWKMICDGRKVYPCHEEQQEVQGPIIVERQAVMIYGKGV